jgi:hypothetical protein
VAAAPLAMEATSEAATSEPIAAAPAPEPTATPEAPATPEESPVSSRPTPRSATAPIPSEELHPVPPPPAADHGRAAVVTAVATAAIAIVALVALRDDDGRVTSESSGIAVPTPSVLDSLPPLPFPLPDTIAWQQLVRDSAAAVAQASPSRADSRPQNETTPAASVAPRQTARPLSTRLRRRAAATRRTRADSVALRDAARRAADSVEREAIRRELEHRRARLDSIARSLEPDSTPSDR